MLDVLAVCRAHQVLGVEDGGPLIGLGGAVGAPVIGAEGDVVKECARS